ncbi:MAG: DUF2752 domain-containing protein [Sphingobacteriaceae bacterium]|nr:DUF2752 domain-containing protein [Sphingobacteriaceae bacterium]
MTKRSKLFENKYYLTAKAIALAVFPLILICLPKTAFNDHENTICLFTLLTDIECYGCGLTRACMHLIHLDFKGAADFNAISLIVFPILCWLYAQEFFTTIKQLRPVKVNFNL